MISLTKKLTSILLIFCIPQGVSVLELQCDSLHTAAECGDGVETEITCLKQLRQPATESECLDSEGSWVENCPVESSSTVDCGHGEARNSEKDWSLSVSTPTLEVHPQEHGFDPPEDRVCLSSNTGRDYCQTEEEAKEPPVVSTQSLSLCDRSEGAQSESEGTDLSVGILPPAVCGKQAEETDRGETVIREGQEPTKGENRSEQEAEESTAKEEETNSQSAVVITPSGDTKALVMGQTPSSEGSEVSDTSDSEMKDCYQEGENVRKEEMKFCQELCVGLSLDEEKTESEGLTPGALPNPLLIDSGDVIEEHESAVPHLLIEGLHEGEPPPDINSLEQNQETAGRDYATEQQKSLAPETSCHSGDRTETANGKELDDKDIAETSGNNIDKADNTADCQTAGNSMEDTRTDQVMCESSPEILPSSGITHSDLDSAMAHSLSSDDDGSFKSVGSSTTEIFNPTQDSATVEDQLKVTAADGFSEGFKTEELNDVKPDECSEHSIKVDAELPLELGTVSALMDCYQTGSKPESQLSPSLQTMEALNPVGKLTPELSKEDKSLGPALSESEDVPAVVVDESESGDNNGSDLNAEAEHSASEVTSSVVFEPRLSVEDENEVTDPVGGDRQLTEATVVASAEGIGDGLIEEELEQEKQDSSEMTTDESSPDEGLRHSENQINESSSKIITPISEPPSPKSEVSSEPIVENEMNEHPEILDAVDGASESHNRENQGEQTLIYLSSSSGLFSYHKLTYVTGQYVLSKSCS